VAIQQWLRAFHDDQSALGDCKGKWAVMIEMLIYLTSFFREPMSAPNNRRQKDRELLGRHGGAGQGYTGD
jgi:hypothetical protein